MYMLLYIGMSKYDEIESEYCALPAVSMSVKRSHHLIDPFHSVGSTHFDSLRGRDCKASTSRDAAAAAGNAGSRARVDEPELGRLLGIRAEPEVGRPDAASQLWFRDEMIGPANGSSSEPIRLLVMNGRQQPIRK